MMMKDALCNKKRDRNEMLDHFIAAYEYLSKHENCNGKIGVVGFCFGGWIANMMAVRLSKLGASVPFTEDSQPPKKLHKLKRRCYYNMLV
jgi:carboxymethylenebutenolidase